MPSIVSRSSNKILFLKSINMLFEEVAEKSIQRKPSKKKINEEYSNTNFEYAEFGKYKEILGYVTSYRGNIKLNANYNRDARCESMFQAIRLENRLETIKINRSEIKHYRKRTRHYMMCKGRNRKQRCGRGNNLRIVQNISRNGCKDRRSMGRRLVG